jgi:hypothetical protein
MTFDGCHLGYQMNTKNTDFDHPRNIPAMFVSNGFEISENNFYNIFPIGSYDKFVLWWWPS